MRLVAISPRPREPMWSADFPYPVTRPGHPFEEMVVINPRSDELYELAVGRQSAGGEFTIDGLDTKSCIRNPIRIDTDDNWRLTYRTTAENAKAHEFSVRMFVQGSRVIV